MELQSQSNNRKRSAHVIKRAKGNRLPQRFIFFDTETETIDDQGTQRLKLVVACSWFVNKHTGIEKVEWFHSKNSKRFYTWFTGKLKSHISTRCMAANVWFDFRNARLYDHMKKDNWQCVSDFSKGHTLIFKFKRKNHRIEFVNIQNYFGVSVKVIGQSIGLPKLGVNFETVNDKDLLTYCKRDVEIIFKAFRNLYFFIRDNKFGSIPYTLPGVSFNCYTHSFMPKQINVHVNQEVLELERKAYYGGRCECFFIGKPKKGIYYKVDINSMYPYIMKVNDFPVKFIQVGINIDPAVILKTAPLYCYIAECEMETRAPVYAMRKNGKLIFPVGRFKTFLTTPALLFGISNGHVKKVLKVACYKKANIFNKFVDYFYNKRMEFRADKNPAFAYLCKIILNSLYGKFGQRTSKVSYTGRNESAADMRRIIIDHKTHKTSTHQVFFGRETIIDQGEEESANSMPAISAHVTDYARLYLWRLIDQAGLKNCFYCDTDSIILNKKGLKNLNPTLHPDKLGLLKVEGEARRVILRGAKHYTFGSDVKCKGIKRGTKQNSDGSFTYPYFPGIISELRHGITEDYRIESQTKRLSGIYDKGIVTATGRVKPFNLKACN